MKSAVPCKICDKFYKCYDGRVNRKVCGSCRTKIRRFLCKLAAIYYLGGKCKTCGWIGSQAAFEFHHRDPLTKAFDVGRNLNKSWDFVKEELDKCDLLCSNCHRISHSDKSNPVLVEAALKYNGKLQFNKDEVEKYI